MLDLVSEGREAEIPIIRMLEIADKAQAEGNFKLYGLAIELANRGIRTNHSETAPDVVL